MVFTPLCFVSFRGFLDFRNGCHKKPGTSLFWGNGCAAPRAMGISIFFFNFAAHPRKKCLLLVRFVPRKKRQEHFHFRFGVRTHAPFAYYNFLRERGFPQLFLSSREKKQKVKIRENGGEKRNIPSPPPTPPVRYDIFHMQEREEKRNVAEGVWTFLLCSFLSGKSDGVSIFPAVHSCTCSLPTMHAPKKRNENWQVPSQKYKDVYHRVCAPAQDRANPAYHVIRCMVGPLHKAFAG